MTAPVLTPACALALSLRAADAAHEAAVIAGARARLATSTLRRRVRRELGAAWWVWALARPPLT